jgi:hypothetical protein
MHTLYVHVHMLGLYDEIVINISSRIIVYITNDDYYR